MRRFTRYCGPSVFTLLLWAALPGGFRAIAETPLQMMPLPAHASAGRGELLLDGGLKVELQGYTEPRLSRATERFMAQLSRETGILAWPLEAAGQPELLIKTGGASAPVQRLEEDEAYRLEITPRQIRLTAANPLGVMHGLETVLQLVRTTERGWVVPAVTIEDRPRFAWRGLMIDSGRHFIPLPVMRQNLDLMAAVKLNVLHWHLSEDQGFRVESRKFPLLQEKGSDGLFYTQEEIRGLIEYARDRGIRVVPEFDMPGHAGAWFAGYPELASGPGPYQIARQWGVLDPAMDPTRESTYTFLETFFAEMTALFPDAYFHIGGDECNGKEWDRNPRIQQYMKDHGLADDAALQASFTKRVQQMVAKDGKIAVGWDEVLQPGTPKDVVIQSWRGQASLADAARGGNRGILSFGYYLDLNETAARHYAVDPLGEGAAKLTAAEQARILGGEAAMWTEYLTAENLSARIWPRAAAVAERLWSPQGDVDPVSMYARLDGLAQKTTFYGIPPGSLDEVMLGRITGAADPGPLKVLAGVVEPPKVYAREGLRAYTTYTPLNRLVDVVPAESEEAREFVALARRIAAGAGTPGDQALARRSLLRWRDNDAVLEPLLQGSAMGAELVPLSRNLSQAAAMGLEALASKTAVTQAERQGNLEKLKMLEAPQAVLLLQIVPGVEALVRGGGS